MMTDVFVVFGVNAKGKVFRNSVHSNPEDAEAELRHMQDVSGFREYYVVKARTFLEDDGDL